MMTFVFAGIGLLILAILVGAVLWTDHVDGSVFDDMKFPR